MLDSVIWQNGQQLRDRILAEPRSQEPKRLLKHGHKVFSQNDEDGIIAEIFRRIGTTSNTFVEIGVGDGAENNTCALLLSGWKGTWVEGNPNHIASITKNFGVQIERGELKVLHRFVTLEFVDEIVRTWGDLSGIDLFSIDIDGNDFHIVEAIEDLKARVVIAEYNARFAPPMKWTLPYRADYMWQGEPMTGCSLSLWTEILATKGYSLVGCNMTGVNAFFVRNDLVEDKFASPFTAENHYEPPRQLMSAWR
jgi:hypothetical protein